MNKSKHYQKYANFTATQAVSNGFGWMSFLDTMAQNSKRSIPELLLIHFQRPDAIDCRTYQEWIKAGTHVRRGAIGIAVPDPDNSEKMRYLFGRGDAVNHAANTSRWKFSEKFEDYIVHALEEAFGTTGKPSFHRQVEHAVNSALDKYWYTHEPEIVGGLRESFRGQSEYNAKLQFMDAAYVSACYMILQRCGMDPKHSFYESDFFCIRDFDSPKAMAILGEAIRFVGNQVLDVIENTIAEQTAQKNNMISAEGKQHPSAIFQPKVNKKEMEVR